MSKQELTIEKIDAQDQVPGRLATQIAVLLLGKHLPSYQPHEDAGIAVEVSNIGQMKLDNKYTNTRGYRFSKKYYSYSGYPGGLKTKIANDVEPAEILRRAVLNMLPKNKQQKVLINRLTIS